MYNKIEIKIIKYTKNFLPDFLIGLFFRNSAFSFFRIWLKNKLLIRPKLKKQLAGLNLGLVDSFTQINLKILVPLIETNHYQFYQILIIAKTLQLRGAQVKVLVCDQKLEGCEIKSERNENDSDPCRVCRFNQHNVLGLFGLETIQISDVLSLNKMKILKDEASIMIGEDSNKMVRHGVNLSRCINDSVVRYYHGSPPEDSVKVSNVKYAHTITALMTIEIAKTLDENWKPDIVLNNMAGYSAWGPYAEYFEKNGDRFRTVSMTPFDYNSIRFNILDILKSTNRFKAYIRTRSSNKLSHIERDTLLQFVENRVSNRTKIFKDLDMFSDAIIDLKNILELDQSKRNIFLFLNIHWDVGLSDSSDLYSDPIALTFDTIEYCKMIPNCKLYIKPHPGDIFGAKSKKGISELIKDKYPVLPRNIIIIEPEWKIKPYDLFDFIDVGVIFTGTLGLEMMLSGIPVISTGLTSHHGLGFAAEPKSYDEYRSLLVGEIIPPPLDRDQLELFAYFYFIRTLIPWTLTKQSFGDNFDGFLFDTLDNLMPGKDLYLDHLCNCILDPVNTIPEAWPH
jgi:hypothetical protein